MESSEKAKVLVIDDDRLIFRIISDCLSKEGYSVFGASDFESGMDSIYRTPPDIILLDVVLPRMNGYEICRLLRNDTRTSHVPIIMLTSKGQVEDKVTGLEAGADDYITKPFDSIELSARVKNLLRRAKQVKSFNPLTGLPGNIIIDTVIKSRVYDNDDKFAVLYLDLDNFKAYNDAYGFLKGDEVIKFLAYIISTNVKNLGQPGDFIGHIGGDDFIVVTRPENVDKICTEIIDQFDTSIWLFYSSEDRKRGYIVTTDRNHREQHFSIMSLSIAVVSNENRNITNHWQIAEVAAELKKLAKSESHSSYVKDRRRV